MKSSLMSFPPFDLGRLLQTVFNPRPGSRLAILIDLSEPREIKDFAFLNNERYGIQRRAVDYFYRPLRDGVLSQLNLKGGDLFAYRITGGSNLDLPETAYDSEGHEVSLSEAVYPNYDIILAITTFSATAPLTAFAKKFGFKGATLHGLNDVILQSGLCVDYREVSREAERLRMLMTRADAVDLDFAVGSDSLTLTLELGRQEAQKSHGLCRGDEPDVANLPAGEVYFVPIGADGAFPRKFPDGGIGLFTVKDLQVVEGRHLSGSRQEFDQFLTVAKSDPAAGMLGELGFGTQRLPWAGVDIQDEKILGTVHVATGRSDHLGGGITPDRFKDKRNASHEDILFAPHKTPEIRVPQVRMRRDGKTVVLIEDYTPSAYLLAASKEKVPAESVG